MNVRRGWYATSALFAAADLYCDQNDLPTFCDALRTVFRTDTPGGRVVFATSFVAFAYWFPGHILKKT